MPSSSKKSRAASESEEPTLAPLAVSVQCCGEGCDERTTFTLMGEREAYEGGMFEAPGWVIGAVEDGEDTGGTFYCKKCFAKEVQAGNLTTE